jgi:phosphate transport system permease protein
VKSAPPAPSDADSARLPTREALLRRRRSWFFGLSGDKVAKLIFQGNATISVIVLALITFTIFRDAIGFIPQNRENLAVYRLAGLEFVDQLRAQVKDYSVMSRFLTDLRLREFERLTKTAGLTPADANARLADFDAFSERFANAISDHETLLGGMTDLVSGLKERYKVASDLREAKQNLIDGIRQAPPERAAILKREADAMKIEVIDFTAEVQPLRAQLPDVIAANTALAATLKDISGQLPRLEDPVAQRQLAKLPGLIGRYLESTVATAQRMQAWDPTKPVSWLESFNAFAFGRQWITASFWQDWYGIIPLFTGSLLIALLALSLAIPLGVAAAIYVNQFAAPIEQRLIKPYIEFIAAIPSVVLGFFGIAVLGETLRRISHVPWLDWVPGFPMLERLNAATAACLLALMAIPTIFSLAEDAINNVPRSFKEASLALGATRLQTVVRIIVPAALSGIMAAILLGFGRVIGETMVVLLCAGNRIEIPDLTAGLGAVFQPVHTMTGIIAQEMGEVVRGSIHYRALFMVGVVLFLISLLINWLAQKIVRRYRISIG